MSDKHQQKKIQLRMLESLLNKTLDNRLSVVDYTTKDLLKPGDNYANTIFDVHVRLIKNNGTQQGKDLYLVAKMPPKTTEEQYILDSSTAFKKEIFMYENIISHYNDLEKQAGFKQSEIFDILPIYRGSRLTLSLDVEFDNDAVILMENLKCRGYYICDKFKGCDFEHSKVTIQAMARFHALGMASKFKQPKYFEVLKQRSKCLQYKVNTTKFYEHVLETITNDPQIAVYFDRCKTALEITFEEGLDATPDEPWSTIIHGDFWVNNVMFHRDENDHVDDIKFVDFQSYMFLSPMRDVIFFLFSSSKVNDSDIEKLIDLYYETFLVSLNRMDCDTKPFNRKDFDKKLDIDAYLEFLHVSLTLSILMKDAQKIFTERLRKVILYFTQRNWI